MGQSFSDVSGGQQAIGGVQTGAMATDYNATVGGYNDAVDHLYKTRGHQPLFTHLELYLIATNLPDRDLLSKSDPMAVVYMKQKDGKLNELGRTEVAMNTLNPSWIVKIPVIYNFENVQPLVVHVYDIDTKYYNVPVKELQLSKQDFLGEASCFLSEVVTKRNQRLSLQLKNPNTNWYDDPNNVRTVTIQAEEPVASRTVVDIEFRCTHLKNTDFFSKSDPFLLISRISENGTVPICKTEVINNNLNPKWNPVSLAMQQFGSKENPLTIECFDFNSSGNHQPMGKLQKSVAELEMMYHEKASAHFVEQKHGHDKIMKSQLFVDKFHEKQLYSFLDYISNGFELNFMVAVDFTASNGDPRDPSSLHYVDPSGRLDAYQRAIVEAGEVLQFYDSDGSFPAWGFGGRIPDGSVSFCFNLNLNPKVQEVYGVEGIMGAYNSAIHKVTLAGPTLVGKVIRKASEIASYSLSHSNHKYYVLLLLTDGVLSDLQETIDALVVASELPLSVLIVGVGDADFSQMKILDADNGHRLKSSTGKTAVRDIVQFVPMREVNGARMSSIQALLEELPGQFLAYMRARDIKPF